MNKQMFNPIVIVIIALGVVGIIMNFPAVLNQLLIVAGGIVVIYLLYKYFTRSNKSSNEKNAYNRAVKQSKRKYASQKREPSKNSPVDLMQRKVAGGSNGSKKKKKQTHLTVIEGKKGKRKDHAGL